MHIPCSGGGEELKEGFVFVLLLPSLQPFHGLQLCDLHGREGSVITINTNPRYTTTTDILIRAVTILNPAPRYWTRLARVIYESGTTSDLWWDRQ